MTQSLATAAPVLDAAPAYMVTGNLAVVVPEIGLADGAVRRLAVLSEALKGLLEVHGGEASLARPVLSLAGREVDLPTFDWERVSSWIPRATAEIEGARLAATYLAPVDAFGGERGVAFRLLLENTSAGELPVELGWSGAVAGADVSRFRTRALDAQVHRSEDDWTGSIVLELVTPAPTIAIGVRGGAGTTLEAAGEAGWSVRRSETLAPGETSSVDVFLSVAPESDGASLGALHLRRRGWDALFGQTRDWLEARALDLADPLLRERLNSNLFFNYFFAQGDCLDTGREVIVTSRSSHYYVSAAFWSRDAYQWTFPALLLVDAARARRVLVQSLRAAAERVADHALYLDGTRLYPGFELDQAAAPIIAIWRYLRSTGDRSLLDEEAVAATIDRFEADLSPWYSTTIGLFGTFLLPTDDPTDFPYTATGNALVASAFEALADLRPESARASLERAHSLRLAIRARLTDEGPHGRMWVWACNERGDKEWRDEPPLGLHLLAYYGVCEESDPLFQNTIAWLDDGYGHHFPGRFGGNGAPHFAFPSGFDLAHRLIAVPGSSEDARRVFATAPWDVGLACESWNADTGEVATGAAMASMAGLLSWALWANERGHRRWDHELIRPEGTWHGGGASPMTPL